MTVLSKKGDKQDEAVYATRYGFSEVLIIGDSGDAIESDKIIT
jgi:hypothetical protein